MEHWQRAIKRRYHSEASSGLQTLITFPEPQSTVNIKIGLINQSIVLFVMMLNSLRVSNFLKSSPRLNAVDEECFQDLIAM